MLSTSTLWRAGVTLLCLGAVGCVIEDADDSAFAVSWNLAYVAGGQLVSCADAGTPTVQLQARHLQSQNAYTTSFPCADLGGVSEVLPSGPYEVTLSLLDALGRPVSAIANGPFDISRRRLTRLPDTQFQIQAWDLAWIISGTDPTGGMSILACADVGAQTVELFTRLGSEGPEMFEFDCGLGQGTSQAIRTGNYAYQVRLLDPARQVLAETDVLGLRVEADRRATVDVNFAF